MRNMISLFFTVFALGAVLILSGCGSNSGNSTAAAGATCEAGYVYSSTYGCLLQSTCASGYGLYNNQCVALTTTTAATCAAGYVYSSTYGCLAQSSCSSGYGLYNNTCVLATTTSVTCPTGYTLVNNTCVVSTTTNTCQGSCPAGYQQTSYGCLPQYKCNSCFGYLNGYCVGSTGYWYFVGY